MRPAVVAENVSKKYILRHERMRSFQQITVDFLTRSRQDVEEFWALRDVNFAVERGETFGIIGSNGSGKSTLLKLIARVMNPTTGRIRTAGRVAALIELGAGFHPDLTGRENVYLHGSFLGFTRGQMRERYQDIVEFAEIEHFMDTPLKHYSSGMMMRLGFSTAIMADADVLIIDEVLAVGDIRFQRKCLDALHDFKKGGGTILLVAQDVGTVRRFCDRALLLSHGRCLAEGHPTQVIDRYVYGDEDQSLAPGELPDPAPDGAEQPFTAELAGADNRADQPATSGAEIRSVRLLNQHDQPADTFMSGDPIRIEIEYRLTRSFDCLVPGLQFVTQGDQYIYGGGAPDYVAPGMPGTHRIQVEIPNNPFLSGTIRFSVGLSDVFSQTSWQQVAYRNLQDEFHILPVSLEEGLLRVPTRWSTQDSDPAELPAITLAGRTLVSRELT